MSLEKAQELIKNCPRGVVTLVVQAASHQDENTGNDTDVSTPLLESSNDSQNPRIPSKAWSSSAAPEYVPLLSGGMSDEALDRVGSVSPPPDYSTGVVRNNVPETRRDDSRKVNTEGANSLMTQQQRLTSKDFSRVLKETRRHESSQEESPRNVPLLPPPSPLTVKQDAESVKRSKSVETEANPGDSDFGEFHICAPVEESLAQEAPGSESERRNDFSKPLAAPMSTPPALGLTNVPSGTFSRFARNEADSKSDSFSPAPPSVPPPPDEFVGFEEDIECVDLEAVEQQVPVPPPSLFEDARGLPALMHSNVVSNSRLSGGTSADTVKPPFLFEDEVEGEPIAPSRGTVVKTQQQGLPSLDSDISSWKEVHAQVGVAIKPPTLFDDDDLESVSSLPPAPPPPSSSPSPVDWQKQVRTPTSTPPLSNRERLPLGTGVAFAQDEDAEGLPPAPPRPGLSNTKTLEKSHGIRPPNVRPNSPGITSSPVGFSSDDGSKSSGGFARPPNRTKTKSTPGKVNTKADHSQLESPETKKRKRLLKRTKPASPRDSPVLFDPKRSDEVLEELPSRADSPEDDMASLPPAPPPPNPSPLASSLSGGTEEDSDAHSASSNRLPQFVSGVIDDHSPRQDVHSSLVSPTAVSGNNRAPSQEQDLARGTFQCEIPLDDLPLVGESDSEGKLEVDGDDSEDDIDDLLHALAAPPAPATSCSELSEEIDTEQSCDSGILEEKPSERLPDKGRTSDGLEAISLPDVAASAPLEDELRLLDEMLALEERDGLSKRTTSIPYSEERFTEVRDARSSMSVENERVNAKPDAYGDLIAALDNLEKEAGKKTRMSDRNSITSHTSPTVVKDLNGNTTLTKPGHEVPEESRSAALKKPRRPAPPVPTKSSAATSQEMSRRKSSSEPCLDALGSQSKMAHASVDPKAPSFMSVFEGQGHAREHRARSLEPSAVSRTHVDLMASKELSPPPTPSKRSRSWTRKLFGSRSKGHKNRGQSKEREQRSRSQSPSKIRFPFSKKNDLPQQRASRERKKQKGTKRDSVTLPTSHSGQAIQVLPSVKANTRREQSPGQDQSNAARRSSRSSPPPPHPHLRKQSRPAEGAALGMTAEEKPKEWSDSNDGGTRTTKDIGSPPPHPHLRKQSRPTEGAALGTTAEEKPKEWSDSNDGGNRTDNVRLPPKVDESSENESTLRRRSIANHGVMVLPPGGQYPLKPPRTFSLGNAYIAGQSTSSNEPKPGQPAAVRMSTAPDLLESASVSFKPQPPVKPVPGKKPTHLNKKDQVKERSVSTGKPVIPKKPEFLRIISAPSGQDDDQLKLEPNVEKACSLEDTRGGTGRDAGEAVFADQGDLNNWNLQEEPSTQGSGPPSFKPAPPPAENQLSPMVVQELVAQLESVDAENLNQEIAVHPPDFKPPPPPADAKPTEPDHRCSSEPDILKESDPELAEPKEISSHKTKPLPPIPVNWQKKTVPDIQRTDARDNTFVELDVCESSEQSADSREQMSSLSSDQHGWKHHSTQEDVPAVNGNLDQEPDDSSFVNDTASLLDEVIVQEFNQQLAEEPMVMEETTVRASAIGDLLQELESTEQGESPYAEVTFQESSPTFLLKPPSNISPGAKLSKSASFSSGDQPSRSPSPSPKREDPVERSAVLPVPPLLQRRRSSSLPSLNPDLPPGGGSEGPGQGYWNTGNLQDLISARNQEADVDEGVVTVQVSVVVMCMN